MNKAVYIHGLNSSSGSNTVRILRERFGDRVSVPDLPDNPARWYDFLEQYLAPLDREHGPLAVTLIGSSTGGFFADCFGERYYWHKVLINPVLDPDDLRQFIGENTNFHTGRRWRLTGDDIKAVKKHALSRRTILPTVVLLGRNDTVIDHRKALEIFQGRAAVRVSDNEHRYVFDEEDMELIDSAFWFSGFY